MKECTLGKDKAASTATEKRITKEERRQAKTRNSERKTMRREERKDGKTIRPRDGTWAKENNRSHFGNKLHTVK
ncbi:MAG: hypothetical protein M1431_01840 [Candidatus Thermoplasmatota archaeon]|nr:hypothetical protein [Candidatus Thermoplasmatota archaeon]